MSAFGSFALSFSVIPILTGAVSLSLLRPQASVDRSRWRWAGRRIVSVMTPMVALSSAELASAYPDGRRALSLGDDPRRTARRRLVDGLAST